MGTPSKQQKALKSTFRNWLKTEFAQVSLRLEELDREIKKHRFGSGPIPVTATDIIEYDLSALLPEDAAIATRLGMLFRARRHHERRLWLVSCAIYGSSVHTDMFYQEFRKAHEDNEGAHRAMLREFVDGLVEETGVEYPQEMMP